ncbi:MAG: SDR family NAD(P)-dependent oxidoreductase [Myxococcaceae bacterium]
MSKTAMVTGATSGIGLEFAERLAKEGYTLTVVGRSEPKTKELAAKLGAGHRALVADLSVAADVARVAEDVRASRYDLLINNAGMGVYGFFHDRPVEELQSITRLNIDTIVTLSHAYLAGAKSGDALMNVASSVALLSFPGSATYCATKAFIASLSECLWYENKARGVYVAGLLPGATKTKFHLAAGGTAQNEAPDSISQTAAGVVDAAMAALASRSSPTVLTSFTNKAMVFLNTRLMPRKSMVNMMGGLGPIGPKQLAAK